MIFIKKHLSWLIALLFFSTTVFLLYSWIDARLSIDHAWSEAESRGNRIEILRGLLQATGKCSNRSDITNYLKAHYKDESKHVLEESQNQISIDDVILIFDANTLTKVNFIGEK